MIKDIQVITGCMFAGKTTELLNRLKKTNKNYLLIKPKIDTRNINNSIETHDGVQKKAITVSKVSDVFSEIDNIQLIAIDEAQFFPASIIEDINYLVSKNIQIVVAGLDKDYLNQPFGYMQQIIGMAKSVTRLEAVCNKCSSPASYSHRITDNSSSQILVGASDQYEALCQKCFDSYSL